MTCSSPSWRSLNPLKGSLNHPKKVTLNHQVYDIYHLKRCWRLDILIRSKTQMLRVLWFFPAAYTYIYVDIWYIYIYLYLDIYILFFFVWWSMAQQYATTRTIACLIEHLNEPSLYPAKELGFQLPCQYINFFYHTSVLQRKHHYKFPLPSKISPFFLQKKTSTVFHGRLTCYSNLSTG